MSAQRKTTVAVIFGGRSVEHDVSIITGHQVMNAFDSERYEVVPVYIDRQGRWFTGEPLLNLKSFRNEIVSLAGVESAILSPSTQHHGLIINPTPTRLFARSQIKRIDVVFPAIHGSHGEDGTLQGLLELADIPYVGCGVLASAIANDKMMTKHVLRQHGVPVLDAVSFSRQEWYDNPDAIIQRIAERCSYPMFIKPVTLGSSIGIGKAADERLLRASIDVAASMDRQVMVESALENAVEINCALMGGGSNVTASVLEQPVSWDQFLTYEEKYMRGDEGMKSAARIIPAPIDDELTDSIQKMAIHAFKAINGRGTTRIDFLVNLETGTVYLNEMNTMPGSMAFYLWQETGMSAREVVHQLVQIARDAYAEKRGTTYDYQTDLIHLTAARGLKGVKGRKSQSTSQAEK